MNHNDPRIQEQDSKQFLSINDPIEIPSKIFHVLRWVVLGEEEEFTRFHENVESVACSCGPAQRETNILEILKD